MSTTNRSTINRRTYEEWEKSKSKAILRRDLLNNTIKPEMKPKQIFEMHPEEHGKWEYANWTNNLRNLQAAYNRDNGRMVQDCLSYGHDPAIVNSLRLASADPGKIPWHKSEAFKSLKEDVRAGEHKKKKPKDLRQTKEEYKAFELDEFRSHIYQIADSEAKQEIRFERKKKAWKWPEIHEDHPRLKETDQS